MSTVRYLIAAPTLDEDSGGSIALHYLCHLLNESGNNARLFPLDFVPLRFSWEPSHYAVLLKQFVRQLIRHPRRYKTNPSWNTPISFLPPGRKTIVVYPEIVRGNPLNAENVVRWLLHKPGHFTGVVEYGTEDLYFYYQRAFRVPHLEKRTDGGLLRISWFRDDIYVNSNCSPRSGSCYMLRKGRGRELVHDLSDSLKVDGLSHEELATVFNTRRYFISYDPYTMYSRFAAMCGCIPIVVPLPGLSKEDWRPEPELRLGIAYGFEDIGWAIESTPQLLSMIETEKRRQRELVDNFALRTQEHFRLDIR